MWQNKDNKLVKDIKCSSYDEVLSVVAKVSSVARQMNHHPEVSFGYSTVHIEVYSHDDGHITDTDRSFVDMVDKLLSTNKSAKPEPVQIRYRNYKDEVGDRDILPKSIWYGSTQWHPKEQWLLKAYDPAKDADRDFALVDIQSISAAKAPTYRKDGISG